VGQQSEEVRLRLVRAYFGLFKDLLQNPEEVKEQIFKKDRTKSKKQQVQERKAALKKLKLTKQNGDIDEAENKVVELVLKGVNVVMNKSKADLRSSSAHGQELRKLLESETDTLFRLTHHKVFRIQIQVFKLLFQFARVTQNLQQLDKPADEGAIQKFADRFYRSLYELIFSVQLKSAANLDEFFGVLFKAMMSDLTVGRVIAFIKRLLQACLANEANFAAATLLVVSEVIKTRPDLQLTLFSFKKQEGRKEVAAAEKQFKI
jgi:ribosome biogenesis protein MAK21